MEQAPPVPYVSIALVFLLPIPPVLYWIFEYYAHERRQVVDADGLDEPDYEEDDDDATFELAGVGSYTSSSPPIDIGIKVLFASLEHSVPGLSKGRAVAGGLGKVVEMISRHHPGDIFMVHPMVKEDKNVSYMLPDDGGALQKDAPLFITVDGNVEEVQVFHHTVYPAGKDGFRAEFLLLEHPLFSQRTKESIYPNPMTRRMVLRMFSLWNQAVGGLIARHRPDVYHCPDFHTAVAPWYAVDSHPDLKVCLTLHNAEYQGGVSTDMIRGDKIAHMASIWNLPEDIMAKHLVQDGRFNMLKSVVDYIAEKQDGKGICAVSQQYANEVASTFSLFWKIPQIIGLPNPMLEEERAQLTDTLEITKRNAKKEIQELCELNVDPDARLFVSMGRLVRQKGVDVVADTVPYILENYPKAQLIIVGPVADGFGCYAKEKLEAIKARPEWKGRVFIKCEFWKAPSFLKFGADFCLMPSRDEPFGYVDIEFAWCGAVMVGAKAGGLGKVPGFYYRAQNRDNLSRLRRELISVVELAMNASKEELAAMGEAALTCTFPLVQWQKRTVAFYTSVMDEGRVRSLSRHTKIVKNDSLDIPREKSGAKEEMVNVAIAKQVFAVPLPPPGAFVDEFLLQELSEEEISTRVCEKLALSSEYTIEQVLGLVGADVNYERESDDITRWMLGLWMGEPIVHWLVCIGYISNFAASMVITTVAIQWGYRSSQFGSDELFSYKEMVAMFGEQQDLMPIPSNWMPMIVTSIEALGFALGAPIWAVLAFFTEPRRLLAANLLLKPMLLLVIAPFQPNAFYALMLVFIQGIISSGALLFVVFNFMMTIEADLSKIALRFGILEMIRYTVSWGLSAYMLFANLANQERESEVTGTAPKIDEQAENPWAVTMILMPVAIILLATTIIPGILLLSAPGPYRDDRCPGWDLGLFFKKKSFIFLALSEVIGDLAKFPSSMFLSWSLMNKWDETSLGWFCVIFVTFFVAGTGAWSYGLSCASVHGMSFLIGVVLLLAPPTILRAVVLEEVSTFTFQGSSNWALAICAASMFLEGVRTSSIWAALIRILNSRYRLLSYGTILTMATHLAVAISPWVCEFFIGMPFGASFLTTSQKQLADAVVLSLVPITIVQFLCQISAMPFIRRDMGIPGSTKKQRRGSWLWQNRQRIAYGTWGTIFLVLAVLFFRTRVKISADLEWAPAHHCHHYGTTTEFLSPCTSLYDETNEALYGLNSFGSNTTSRHKCYDTMINEKGDTFVFSKNRCQVLSCEDDTAFAKKSYLDNGANKGRPEEVWSKFCSKSGNNYVSVQLFEWTWNDIALECEQNLGPSGYDSVGVSPPFEHIQGDSWFLRYQPVSYKLNSRSGTEKEFTDMVKRCTDAGVDVMTDVIVNHMAGPWILNPAKFAGQTCETDAEEKGKRCEGWAGTKFGNREFLNGETGYDVYNKSMFHHYPQDDGSNCGCPPWLNNQVMCDFSGLPDLDTENPRVQSNLIKMLTRLHEIGVTMLRVDAARHVFPESLAIILNRIPWEYITLEVYDTAANVPVAFNKLLEMGHLYDFAFSKMLSQIVADGFDEKTQQWKCEDSITHFKELMTLKPSKGHGDKAYMDPCTAQTCNSPVPEQKTMIFIDNHDRQRERWKSAVTEPGMMCVGDTYGKLDECLVNFKYGKQYHLMNTYMMTQDYGDTIRLMSSYAFFTMRQGAPGVSIDSLHDAVLPVYTKDSNGKWSPTRCRSKPQTSPAEPYWDEDEVHPWICDHRWSGVSAMIRFRKLVYRDRDPKKFSPINLMENKWSDQFGRIAYSTGAVGWVALSRGYNWLSQCGGNETKDLVEEGGPVTSMPEGTFCNLASIDGPLGWPDKWKAADCTVDTITIGPAGKITQGALVAGEMIVIHKDYPAPGQKTAEYVLPVVLEKPVSPTDFWGWRKTWSRDEDRIGCCYIFSLEWNDHVDNLRTSQKTQLACLEDMSSLENVDDKTGWNHLKCPKTAAEAFEEYMWAQQSETKDVGVTGSQTYGKVVLANGVFQFNDRSDTLSNIPESLLGGVLFQGPRHHVSGNTIEIVGPEGSTVNLLVSYGNAPAVVKAMKTLLADWTHTENNQMDTTAFAATGFNIWTTSKLPITLVIPTNGSPVELSIVVKFALVPLKEAGFWTDTENLFVFILVIELMVCGATLLCHRPSSYMQGLAAAVPPAQEIEMNSGAGLIDNQAAATLENQS